MSITPTKKPLEAQRTSTTARELKPLDFGLAGLAYDDDVVIVGWLARHSVARYR